MNKRTMRMFALLITLVLALCAFMPTALAEETWEIDLNLGSDTYARFILPLFEGLDLSTLMIDGVPYTPSVTDKGQAILLTGDLLAALAAQGANLEDTFIQGGKLRQTGEDGTIITPAVATANPFSLIGKTFTLTDAAGNTVIINIVNIWQSPLRPAGYDPDSVAGPSSSSQGGLGPISPTT